MFGVHQSWATALSLGQTEVADTGVKALQTALPECDIRVAEVVPDLRTAAF